MSTTTLPILHPTLSNQAQSQTRQTGPKSAKGKARSRLNAMKHGCRSREDIFVFTLSNREVLELNRIHSDLKAFYSPKYANERAIVYRIAIHQFRLMRLYKLESDALNALPPYMGGPKSILPHLDRLSRYDVRTERQIRMLHNRLISVKQQRGSGYFKPFSNNE